MKNQDALLAGAVFGVLAVAIYRKYSTQVTAKVELKRVKGAFKSGKNLFIMKIGQA